MVRDFKYALRFILRSKGYVTAVIATLSACIGVNVAIFAIVNSVLLRPLPVPESDRIVLMSNRYPKAGAGDQLISSSGDYFDRREKVTALEDQALFKFSNETIDVKGTAEREKAMMATPSLFNLVRVAPLLGRTFSAAEGEIGSEQKIVLTYGLWQQMFGGDYSALGREVRLNGRPFTVVGVMPRNFVFVDPEVRMWIPAAFTDEEKTVHHNNDWYDVGRLKPGATIQQVQAQIDALNAVNLEKFPNFRELLVNAGFYTSVEPLQEMVVREVRSVLRLLWAGSTFVLLIGVLNVANLAVARLTLRKKEFATRMALGAGRTQLLRQFLAGGVCPLLRRSQSIAAAAQGRSGPALLPAVILQVAFVALAGLAVSLAALSVLLLIRDWRRGGRPGGLREALSYLAFQTIGVLLAVVSMPLYFATLAIHYVEYHVLMFPRCFHSRLDAKSTLDRCFGRLRRRPAVFYSVLVISALVVSIFTNSSGMADVSTRYLAVISIFDGLFVFHYFVEMLIWRFSDPFFRRTLSSLYFPPRMAPATLASVPDLSPLNRTP